MIEGSGSASWSIPLTSGSGYGSGRPKTRGSGGSGSRFESGTLPLCHRKSCRFLAERRLFKANSTQKIRPVKNVLLEKKWFHWVVHWAYIVYALKIHITMLWLVLNLLRKDQGCSKPVTFPPWQALQPILWDSRLYAAFYRKKFYTKRRALSQGTFIIDNSVCN